MARPITTASERIALIADEHSFEVWYEDLSAVDPLEFSDTIPYTERLAAAKKATGAAEAVKVGRAELDGREVVVVASEFGFLGGSIGTVTGELVARAFARAERERLPLIAIPASGGTRMQEGTLAVMAMAKLAAAARRLRRSGLPYVVYLTHPTTGGVLASWGSLGTVTFAQPGALIGFTGPRVVEMMTGAPLPPGIQTAENLLAHGLVDDVVPPAELRERVIQVLSVTSAARTQPPSLAVSDRPSEVSTHRADPWRSLQIARHPERPSARDFLEISATDITELRGDGTGQDDRACFTALAKVRGVPAVVVAQARDRAAQIPASLTPAGYRKVRRALGIARELELPVVTVVDTPGAEMSVAAEEGGVARAIAHVLADMSDIESPTLAVLLGEGGSGGALALLLADRVICVQHASLSPIAPEGASAILYRTTERAPELAATQGIGSADLQRWGIVDLVVEERPRADEEPRAFLDRLADVVDVELRALLTEPVSARLDGREQRYRSIGQISQEASYETAG